MFNDLGLLFFRVFFGCMMFFGHGWQKLANFSQTALLFPDPIGIGSTFSLYLVIFAEVACSALIIVGLTTRLAALPLLITMCVAIFGVHVADPFVKKELAMMYGGVWMTLIFMGPGGFSIDGMIQAKRKIKGAIFRP